MRSPVPALLALISSSLRVFVVMSNTMLWVADASSPVCSSHTPVTLTLYVAPATSSQVITPFFVNALVVVNLS